MIASSSLAWPIWPGPLNETSYQKGVCSLKTVIQEGGGNERREVRKFYTL